MPTPVPSGSPPVLLTSTTPRNSRRCPTVGAAVRYEAGQLRIAATVPDANQRLAADQTIYRDVIVQAQVSLVEGGDDDLYGLFLRSPSARPVLHLRRLARGHVVISRYDGEYDPLVAGTAGARHAASRRASASRTCFRWSRWARA